MAASLIATFISMVAITGASADIVPLIVTKSANPPSGHTVQPGDTITYTLSFDYKTQRATAPNLANVNYFDDLSKVLDDASVTEAPHAGAGSLTVGPIGTDHRFHITGLVPKGEAWTVIYKVKVDNPDTGDGELDNFVVPTGATPPTTCQPGNPRCTHHPVTPPVTTPPVTTPPVTTPPVTTPPTHTHAVAGVASRHRTAVTGGDWALELCLGGLLLGGGGLITMAGMRRRRGTR
ncbi:MAG TPA: hypothetical protein VKB75_09985 [Jatrophihabitans sp.]|nr:hypothetical protein [Jatrophihabitans sp.]